MTSNHRWQGKPRRVALLAVGALAAGALTTVSALPASAAVSCQVDYSLRSVWPTGFTACPHVGQTSGTGCSVPQ